MLEVTALSSALNSAAPDLTGSGLLQGAAEVTAYLPNARWYDYHTVSDAARRAGWLRALWLLCARARTFTRMFTIITCISSRVHTEHGARGGARPQPLCSSVARPAAGFSDGKTSSWLMSRLNEPGLASSWAARAVERCPPPEAAFSTARGACGDGPATEGAEGDRVSKGFSGSKSHPVPQGFRCRTPGSALEARGPALKRVCSEGSSVRGTLPL